ncbi:GGDEF domain-containing protein [Leucobacter denitrificans]|uniref:GGDEF domain-containing protein n=1 Tax=Leucobacter denitrificans TaxID=683042 RepID=A0A7G9S2D2_9MICO|nr:GGDEF domain-containing protein [Leucobacter denitrificans]QNN62007.1 GGDEF domain-containing protein [Leucobacter denitrificans]
MPERSVSRLFKNQSELSIAVAAVFVAGGIFAVLTAILFPPERLWTWPNPHIVALATFTIAILILLRGRRLRRPAAVCTTGAYVCTLIVTAAFVENIERALAAGLLIMGVTLIFAWFMPPLVTRLFGHTSLAAYGVVLLIWHPGNGTVLISLAIAALSVLLTEIYGSFKRELQRTVLTDHLCQVWNRAGFERMLEREIRSVVRSKAPLSLLYLDLDGFKSVNDTEGHLAGDRVLQQVSRSLEASVRGPDTVARIGGDEFVLILPETTAAAARALGLRLRNDVTACEWSFGVAEYQNGESAQEFIERSDAEMLEYKRKRRHKASAAVQGRG